MPTLDDVAQLAGVSRMTASNALRGKPYVKASTKQKVLNAAKTLNYQPNLAARFLSSGKTNVIGFSTVELDNSPFSGCLAASISDQAFALGYQTLIQQTRFSERYEHSMMSEISTQFCAGTILSAPNLPKDELIQLSAHYPLVVFDGPELDGKVDRVCSPCEEGAKAAVEHLIDRGAHRVALLGFDYLTDDRLAKAETNKELRCKGAARALASHDMPFGPQFCIPCEWNYQDAAVAFEKALMQNHDFDALFCACDVVAVSALHVLRKHGLHVPHDVKVIGFDGLAASRYTNPTLSTVSVDIDAIARECLRLLMRRIDNPAEPYEPEQVTLPFHITEAESTAA